MLGMPTGLKGPYRRSKHASIVQNYPMLERIVTIVNIGKQWVKKCPLLPRKRHENIYRKSSCRCRQDSQGKINDVQTSCRKSGKPQGGSCCGCHHALKL